MWFLFIVMPILSVIKVTTQGRFSQKNIKTFSDVLLYNTAVYFFSALVLAVIFLRVMPPVEVWLYALIGAVGSILMQSFYTLAYKHGPITPTVIINSFNIIIPITAGFIFFNEKWSSLTAFGLILMGIAFYLVPARNNDKKINSKWLFYVIATFILTGLYGVLTLFFSKSEFSSWQNEYITLTVFIAGIFCSLLTLFNVKVRKDFITIKKQSKLPLIALVIGSAIGIYNILNVIAFKYYPSYVVTPIVSGTIMVLTMVVNSILNKEFPTKKMIIGVIAAVISIVLLNI